MCGGGGGGRGGGEWPLFAFNFTIENVIFGVKFYFEV